MPHQNPRTPFPAWRLPNGIINANEGDLELSIGSCETWEWWGGGLVIVGVIATVLIASLHPPYDSFWERWGSAVADALVAIGVAAEIKFGQMAGLRQNALKRRSDERVAKAELETEKLRSVTSWRTLSAEQFLALTTGVTREGPSASVRICLLLNDQESFNFASIIAFSLRGSGWNVGFRFDSYTQSIMTGVLLPKRQNNWTPSMLDAADRIRKAFVDANIPFATGWPLAPAMSIHDDIALTEPIAWVYIGPKPVPML